jgi:hypothetical protein
MHILHLDLGTFLAQHDGLAPIYVARWAMRRSMAHIDTSLSSHLLAGYERDGTLHLAHLPVEASPLPGEPRQALQERLELAHTCLLAALPLERVREGLVLVPGLWGELERFSTDHDLWSWRKGETAEGRPTRILVPQAGA